MDSRQWIKLLKRQRTGEPIKKVDKCNFRLKKGVATILVTASCLLWSLLFMWILNRESKLYYLFALMGCGLFYCWVSHVENHFEIVYIP